MQDAICVKPQAGARTADFIAFALTPLRPENRYDEASGLLYKPLSQLEFRRLRLAVGKTG